MLKTAILFTSMLLLIFGGAAGVYIHLNAEQPKTSSGDDKEIVNTLGMKLTRIPAGKFTMGSPKNELHRNADETQHEVAITKPFYLGVHEVTQGEYQKVM